VSAIDGVEVVFAQTIAGAKALIAEMIADAGGAPIALDLETAPLPAERAKLQALLEEREAAAKRKTAAKREIKKTEKEGKPEDALRAEVAALEARLKRLDKQIEIAETAGLDPRSASIRLCGVYGGGRRCGLIDVAKASELALASLNGVSAVIHNASFDCAFLARAGVMLGEVHDTLQASKLALGESRSSLAQAVAHFCDHALDKEEQASDWGGSLTPSKIAYAARDIIWLWRLAQRIYPDPADSADLAGLPARRRGPYEVSLADQAEAYQVANAAVPSFVKLNARGVMFDPVAHEDVLRALANQDAAASDAYKAACRELGRDDLAERVPRTDAETATTLKALLSDSELSTWSRVDKPWGLSTAKSELRKAVQYAPVVAMIGLAEARLARSQWGATLPLMVANDGRLYPNYRVAGAASGRSTCASPNIQGVPRDPRFRRIFIAAPGFTFVAADYGSMDLRTAAYFFEDATLACLFTLDGVDRDPHALMASRVTGKAPEEVTPEERSKAKGCNFGSLYGIQALALIEQIWRLSPDKPIRVTAAEAQELLDAFARTYPDLTRHRAEYAARCMREGRIVIGRDRFATTGRIIPFRRLRRDQNPTTCSFAYPIQGLNAVIAMNAMTRLDRALIEQRVDGGLAIFNHDELVLEVREVDAERAGALLKDAMESAFVEMFPSATLKGLVEVQTGANWAATKQQAEPEPYVEAPSGV
jgi:DNA polymerase-1